MTYGRNNVLTCLFLVSVASAPAYANNRSVDLRAAAALIERVVPGHSRDFRVEAIADNSGLEVFEVSQDRDRIVLRGSSGVAIAAALNWYLENVAGVNVSLPLQPIRISKLPAVTAKVRISTPYAKRYFFNYCTFSYSMAWWDWTQWEHLIDWMALKGINTPLAVTGQEAVWRLVLQDLGFTRKQREDFLVGPAYFPWGWMGNIDGLGGPLPDSWIDSHIALERRILARERSLGMTPVLQSFTGHVPESTKDVFPQAKLHKTGDWSAGFSGTWFVDPLDPLFQRFGKRFIERQTELFGTDHLYAADPFNEIDPPSNDSTFLAGMGRAIYSSMQSSDSSATWILQGWFLYYQAKFWQEPQARALLGAVPDDRMIVLDLWGDRYPVWQKRQAFYGKPWIWNVLYNFGGKTSLNGDLPRIAANLDSVRQSPAKGRLTGLGMMMEGLGTNPIVPDFVMDQTWRTSVPAISEWTQAYITRRYGAANSSAWKAWQQLLATAYKSSAQTGNFLAERPDFYVKGRPYRSEPVAPYDGKLLAEALDTLLNAAPALGRNDAYQYDVVNLTRQVLGQLGVPFVNQVQDAYVRKDHAALMASEQRVLTLLTDLDALVGTREEFLLGRWIADAKRWATTDAERRLYEWNARNLITLWGTKCTEGQNDDLNLYAYKEWQGMFAAYFRPRWQEFFVRLNRSLDANTPFDRAPFANEMCTWEQSWSRQTNSFPTQPNGNPMDVASKLVRQYRSALTALVFTALVQPPAAANAQAISYTMRFPAPNSHVAEVEARIPAKGRGNLDLMLPVWSPGYYVQQDYAKNVQSFAATSRAGAMLSVEKPKPNHWLVTTGGADTVVIKYALLCTSRFITGCWVDSAFAVLNGPSVFITINEAHAITKRPYNVRLELAPTWPRSVSSLDIVGSDSNHYRAPDYDTFIDSPIIAGAINVHPFDVGTTKLYLADFGNLGAWDGTKVAGTLQRIVAEHRRFLGTELPFRKYVFLNSFRGGAGGLEHLNSSLLSSPQRPTQPEPGSRWLKYVSHEFFHAINVKRLRPIELGPFDYEKLPSTPSLWIAEGLTTTYGDLAVVRSGVGTLEDYLAGMSGLIRTVQTSPGRLVQTLEQASTTSGTTSSSGVGGNRDKTISYYDKGPLAGLIIDARIRKLTNDRKSLDDVMRLAIARYSGARGYTPEEFVAAASEVAGADMSPLFRKLLATTDELDFSEAFDWFGLAFVETGSADPAKAWSLVVRADATSLQGAHLKRLVSP